MAYPWPTPRDRWVLAVGVLVLIVLLGWWQGLHFTTMLRRRLAMSRSGSGLHTGRGAADDTRATAVLRVAPSDGGPGALPVALVAGYLDRYGLRADAVRITSRDVRSGSDAPAHDTWIGLTYSAAANLPALQARSSSIPLRQTVDVAARRLADQLREAGWDAVTVGADELPDLIGPSAHETWGAVTDGPAGCVAVYQVGVDGALADNLNRIRSAEVPEAWTVLEIAGSDQRPTVAAACALRTATAPVGTAPLSGLVPEQGNHRSALVTLNPLSGRRIDGHTTLPAGDLAALRWPVAPVKAAAAR
ncbi:type VII secretion protein EccE [Mycobacterium sp. M1]|uniref:Type VII secretion protein EccE n=2 Tax=Mycolicibacter acidiphilus TaxID=2835306 RepID=A0ABS5RNC3_9MYCO|nr:type VII secretion protein EccE [Mycolicibacter acidiphilus]